MGSNDFYGSEDKKMAFSTAKDILDQTLENFPNLTEFKIDFLGKFIKSRENRNNFRQMYEYK